MANFAGVFSAGEVQVDPSYRSALVSAHSGARFTPIMANTAGADPWGTRGGTAIVVVEPHVAKTGIQQPMYGGLIFEKILVIPRKKPLGFVLSPQVFPTEVWSTFSGVSHALTAITITGAGDMEIANPFTLPKVFWPGQSEIFTTLVPAEGSATINTTAVFAFDGISGTDLLVTGSRLAVFAVEIDWEGNFTERVAYKTTVLRGHSDSEQRIQTRSIPRRGATYRVTTLTARETSALQALIWTRKSRLFGVPWWCDVQPLTAAALAGDGMIDVNTVNRTFENGGLVMLWRDQFTYEVVTIDVVSPGSLTLSSTLGHDWPQLGTWVMPVRRGRLLNKAEISSPIRFAASMDLVFSCEVI